MRTSFGIGEIEQLPFVMRIADDQRSDTLPEEVNAGGALDW